jgi:hypothetical protein
MSETHRVEIAFDDSGWAAVEGETTRLGIDAEQLIARATRVWIAESADNRAAVGKREPLAAE